MESLFHKEKRIGFAHDRDLVNGKEEWLTPPEIIGAFGPFDLDPCAPVNRPWPTAVKHFTVEDNGLIKPWNGFVWCNPPYGPKTGDWLKRCAEHNNCLVLIFARTETEAFQEFVFKRANVFFFFKRRINFYHVNGKRGGASGAPSVLVAYGEQAAYRLQTRNQFEGHLLTNS
jgi:DNA N-6-adenine-methyltransferase (Dam)